MKIFITISVIILVLIAGFIHTQKTTPNNSEVSNSEMELEERPTVETVAEGIKRPHGIVVDNGVVYVSSEVDKALYKIKDGKSEKLADLNFTHDSVGTRTGFITPVFYENRVVEVSFDGKVKDILKTGLSGPNGITASISNQRYFVTNYNSGSVISFNYYGSDLKVLANNLKGPAGVVFDPFSLKLYVANFLNGSVSVIRDKEREDIKYEGLKSIESLTFDHRYNDRNRLLATAVKEGKGVIVELKEDGTYEILFTSDLPDPVVGYFAGPDVYLVSPNDSQGRVLRVRLYWF